ncbi:MAG: hypothetical protein IJW99_04510 [Clostridia bacterium]|nr:hypothetical protein [Clostridia bacterium]
MVRAGKLRSRQAPPRPCRFGCRGARRSEWGCLLCETKATDGTFGAVEQTISPIMRPWGRSGRGRQSGGLTREPDV